MTLKTIDELKLKLILYDFLKWIKKTKSKKINPITDIVLNKKN